MLASMDDAIMPKNKVLETEAAVKPEASIAAMTQVHNGQERNRSGPAEIVFTGAIDASRVTIGKYVFEY